MTDLTVKEGMPVRTAAGDEAGKVDRVVIDPGSLKITHVVIQKGLLGAIHKVVPLEWIAGTEGEALALSAQAGDIDSLPDFEEAHYIRLDEEVPGYSYPPGVFISRPFFWYPPAGYGGAGYGAGLPPVATRTEQNIPEGTVALKEGAQVLDKDGNELGSIEHIIAGARSGQVTHFILSSGLLFKERKLIPIHWVVKLTEDRVFLEVGAKFLERIPSYQDSA